MRGLDNFAQMATWESNETGEGLNCWFRRTGSFKDRRGTGGWLFGPAALVLAEGSRGGSEIGCSESLCDGAATGSRLRSYVYACRASMQLPCLTRFEDRIEESHLVRT
jgi:hypothetical protein